MHAILVDDIGDVERIDLDKNPYIIITVAEFFFPCGACGSATLNSRAMGLEHDMCRKCYKEWEDGKTSGSGKGSDEKGLASHSQG